MDPYEYDDEYPAQQKKGFLQSNMKAVIGVAVCLVILVVVVVAIVLGIELTRNENNSTTPDDGDNTPTEYWKTISLEGLQETLKELQSIADKNGGTRTVESPGYNASVEYIRSQLESKNAFDIWVQPFTLGITIPLGDPTLQILEPNPRSFIYGTDYAQLSNSGFGNVTGPLINIPSDGCLAEYYADVKTGDIPLISRGNCSFADKANLAVEAGAAGVLIYNHEPTGLVAGTLGETPFNIPVFGLTNIAGYAFQCAESVEMYYNAETQEVFTSNLIAETRTGDPDSVIVVGSHLDSVSAGPGINDNGSGSSANLQMALNFPTDDSSFVNRVRFIWYGAEEEGLVGSTFYVNSLNETEKAKIALNLNFDMLGSPNFQRGILNGSAAEDPNILQGSTLIMQSFIDFFESQGLTWQLIPFTGRSDYGPYLEHGIPAGGIETGAEKIKDVAGRKLFGGLADTPYDPCYHLSCDTYDNINFDVLLEMSQAAAYSLQHFATQTDLKTLLNVTSSA